MAANNKITIESKIQSAVGAFEAKVFNSRSSIRRWISSTALLLGMTNTYARWLITISSYGVLFGWGFYALYFEVTAPEYAIALIICFAFQAASVRFIFRWNELNDEYQSTRRDTAYRRAYKRIRQILVLIAALWFFFTIVADYIDDHSGISFHFPLEMNNYRVAVATIFLVGLMTLQKYASYGMKGEPFVSVAEFRKQRDS